MKEIKLTQGKVAIVEDKDFEYLNKWKWFAQKDVHTYYAARTTSRKLGKQVGIKMHRQILGITNPKILCDHRDHNGLNNVRSNLRVATGSQNNANRKSAKNSTSNYLGVSLHTVKDRGKLYTYWVSQIRDNEKQIKLGYFKSEKEAALAYNKAAISIRGEFANLNAI